MKYYIIAAIITAATAIILIPIGQAQHGEAIGGEWAGVAGAAFFASMWAAGRAARAKAYEKDTRVHRIERFERERPVKRFTYFI